MTRYTTHKKRFNPAQHSSGVHKPTTGLNSQKGRNVDVSKMVQMRKKVCLKCRKRGHSLRECPENDDSSTVPSQTTQANTKCYKCGAADHTSKSCTIAAPTFKFATCFYCHQTGHLASQCTSNPNGVYPKGGGCRFCGSVRHFAKECDQRGGKKEEGAVVGEEDGFLEPVVDMQAVEEKVEKEVRKVKKVVSFK